jgi:hypothetical protein
MRVRVKSVGSASASQTCVSFVCDIGGGSGQWLGSAPSVDAEYDVEIDLLGVLKWGEQVRATEQLAPSLAQREQLTVVVGTLQAFDGEVAELRLLDDVVLVEVDRVGSEVPCQVEIQTRGLRLFDANT